MRVPKPLTSEQSRLLEQAEALMRSRIRADGAQLSDPSAAGSMFRYRLANHEREVFSVAFLTTRHRVICVEDLFCGTLDGAVIYQNLCSGCHTSGAGGAPTLDHAHWDARLAQGKDTLYKHSIDGFTGSAGVMPAKGGNPALSVEQMHAAVDWMVDNLK